MKIIAGNEDILNSAISKWGSAFQILKTVEESAELSTALMHFLLDPPKISREDVIEEIADVMIMIHQMRLMFGPDAVDRMITQKLRRLRSRLADEG
jgi:NTP pyrophosphatase (non-canonical NTP hydrolase)